MKLCSDQMEVENILRLVSLLHVTALAVALSALRALIGDKALIHIVFGISVPQTQDLFVGYLFWLFAQLL